MRDLMIIFESTRFDAFISADTPNLDSLGKAVLATTHGLWTRPSIVSILSGYLPQSELGQIYKPSWTMLSPEVFDNKDIPAYFLNANQWVNNMFPRRYKDMLFPDPSGPEMVREASKIMRSEPEFFVCIFFTESHGPYHSEKVESEEELKELSKLFKAFNNGDNNGAPDITAERNYRSISYLDRLIKPLLDIPDRVIFTSDHGELMGEHHKVGHDPSFPWHAKLFEVPLIISNR